MQKTISTYSANIYTCFNCYDVQILTNLWTQIPTLSLQYINFINTSWIHSRLFRCAGFATLQYFDLVRTAYRLLAALQEHLGFSHRSTEIKHCAIITQIHNAWRIHGRLGPLPVCNGDTCRVVSFRG